MIFSETGLMLSLRTNKKGPQRAMSGRSPAALFQGRARVRTRTTKVIILRNIAVARNFIARVIRAGNWPVKRQIGVI
jgi:hypothetical protein